MRNREVYIIETVREVKNPSPDRRSKDDWDKWPVIPKGTRFIVHRDTSQSEDWRDRTSESIRHERYWGSTIRTSELGKMIEANAERVEPKTPEEMAEIYADGHPVEDILRVLVKMGRVGPEDFKAVATVPEDF